MVTLLTSAVLAGSVLYFYGILPGQGSFPLQAYVQSEGWSECLEAGRVPCEFVGYPVGVQPGLGLAVQLGTYLLSRAGFDLVTAMNLWAVTVVSAGVVSLWYLTNRLARNKLVAALSIPLYFGSAAVVSHMGLTSLFFGFAFLPVPVASILLATHAVETSILRFSWRITGVVIAYGVMVYFDPYPYVLAAVIGGALVMAKVYSRASRRQYRRGFQAAAALPALLLPAALYLATVPSNATAQMPIDFYRAMGTDVVHLVVPTESQAIASWLDIPIRWKRSNYYGDGSQLQSAYLGGLMLATAAVGAVVSIRDIRTRYLAIALSVAGAACFAVGFGPSLKVLDRAPHPIAPDGVYDFTDYLMPEDAATVSTPWSFLYNLQPFASMRATYRWHVAFRLVAVAMACVAIARLAGRHRVAAFLLCIALVAEALPKEFIQSRDRTAHQATQVETFRQNVNDAFRGLRPYERVLFLPAANDYLIMGIAPRLDLFAYNISFDKEIGRIRPQQPEPVTSAITAFDDEQLTSGDVAHLLSESPVDAVVFPHFRLRWDSYSWPPDPDTIAEMRRRVDSLALESNSQLQVSSNELMTLVRSTTPK